MKEILKNTIIYSWAEEERHTTLTYSSVLMIPDILVFKDHMTGEAIHQYSTRGLYFKVMSDQGEKKINFLCDSLRHFFYLIIILYISSTVVNQNIQFFFALRRLSTEMSMTLSTFTRNLFVFGFFETRLMWLFPDNCFLWQQASHLVTGLT